jgi:hypothetical protein
MTPGDAIWIVAGVLLAIVACVWVSRGRTHRSPISFANLEQRPCAFCGAPIPPGVPPSAATCEACAVALSELVCWWRGQSEGTRHYRLAAWRKGVRGR